MEHGITRIGNRKYSFPRPDKPYLYTSLLSTNLLPLADRMLTVWYRKEEEKLLHIIRTMQLPLWLTRAMPRARPLCIFSCWVSLAYCKREITKESWSTSFPAYSQSSPLPTHYSPPPHPSPSPPPPFPNRKLISTSPHEYRPSPSPHIQPTSPNRTLCTISLDITTQSGTGQTEVIDWIHTQLVTD